MNGPPAITPGTRVNELLESWPQLEDVLISSAPEFRKLRNPVLRRTVGRVATLARAAQLAGLDPVALVNRLRAAVGQDPLVGAGAVAAPEEETPAWLATVSVNGRIRADEILEAGQNPLPRVREAVAGLPAGSAVAVRSSFRPVPLVEALRSQGLLAFTRRDGDVFETVVAQDVKR